VGRVRGDVRASGPDVEGEKVVGWGEFFGEGLEVLIQGEETEQDCDIGWGERRELGLGLYGFHLVPYLYRTTSKDARGFWAI
jgi:hypothetical protein